MASCQKVSFGTYDNYIPVSELSKKSWNQQHFALAFPKPPRPGQKRRSKPSQLQDGTIPEYDEDKLREVPKRPLWMHRSLMAISERPSVYLAARRPPHKPTQHSKEDAKVPSTEKSISPELGKKDKEDKEPAKKDKLGSEAETIQKDSKKYHDTKGEDVAKADDIKDNKGSKKIKGSTTESEDEKKGAKKDKDGKKDAKKSSEKSDESKDKKDAKKDAKKQGSKKDKKDEKKPSETDSEPKDDTKKEAKNETVPESAEAKKDAKKGAKKDAKKGK
ncbi:hypothetical protein MC885_013271 [Smutsia gigantea]|nr:hypothetical protein MC885_013271 [Smutsia gigantea]